MTTINTINGTDLDHEQLDKKEKIKVYTDTEVAKHCFQDDCWVTIFDKVFDITCIFKQNRGKEHLHAPILKYAGHSISHWFDGSTGDIKTFVDPKTNLTIPYLPGGLIIDAPPPTSPVSNFEIKSIPWWNDTTLVVGQVRKI